MQKRRGDLIINVNHELPSIKKHQEKVYSSLSCNPIMEHVLLLDINIYLF